MGLIARYVTGLYLPAFAAIMALGVVLSTTINFFNRIGEFTELDAAGKTMLAYFLLKAPSIVPEVFPLATLLGASIIDGASNAATLTLPSPGASGSLGSLHA